MTDHILNGVLGLAVGDALGYPAQGKSRESLKFSPVLAMQQGLWSDDTSLTLCTLASLRENDWRLDYYDLMRRFASWLQEGYLTPEGTAFDVGATTKQALLNYLNRMPLERCAPRNQWNCGNGSLMRILPVEFYLQAHPEAARYEAIRNVSALTYAHICCTLGCFLYCTVAGEIIQHRERFKLPTLLMRGVAKAVEELRQVADTDDNRELHYYSRIIDRSLYDLPAAEIESSGYVVDTLEAALWCLANTDSYRECLLWAVNLGDDADTVAAVAGSLAGLYYGYDSIPREWLAGLKNLEAIVRVCG
ncbi:ADP-ribosylglycohydrolase family protein [Phascolarctobacterium sp.]